MEVLNNNISMSEISHQLLKKVNVSFLVIYDIIKEFISSLTEEDKKFIDIDELIEELLSMSTEEMTLNNLYYLISDHCATKTSHHPFYNFLASKVYLN